MLRFAETLKVRSGQNIVGGELHLDPRGRGHGALQTDARVIVVGDGQMERLTVIHIDVLRRGLTRSVCWIGSAETG